MSDYTKYVTVSMLSSSDVEAFDKKYRPEKLLAKEIEKLQKLISDQKKKIFDLEQENRILKEENSELHAECRYLKSQLDSQPKVSGSMNIPYELGNSPELIAIYREACNGNMEKALALGREYDFGNGVKRNKKEALRWYLLAASTNSEAAWRAGHLLVWGENIEHKPEKAFELFRLSAKNGNRQGMYYLGYCYDKAIGTNRNGSEAVNWYMKVADTNGDAAWRAGWFLVWGENNNHDEKKAFELFQLSAKNGNRQGMYYVGYCYDLGIGTQENKKVALEYYLKVADSHADASWRAGHILKFAKDVVHDDTKALQLFKRSAELGSKNGKNYYEKYK